VNALVELADHLFDTEQAGDDAALTFTEFMDVLLQLRGSVKSTKMDIVELKKFINKVLKNVAKLRAEVSEMQALPCLSV